MKLEHITYTGPAIDDPEMIAKLPEELAALLQQFNGFIQFHGGLHMRGACVAPDWHSLRHAWEGEAAFRTLYPGVQAEDVPFGEDCLGDQFLLREGMVWRLFGETGELEPVEMTFHEFMEASQDDPGEHLGLHPLLQFQRDGGKLQPGELLAAWPPFCTEESADGVTLKAISALERRRFLADLARQIRETPEGEQIQFQEPDE